MRAIFIADAHLKNEQDDNYRCFLQFLDGLCGSIDALFILGDLFEFWIGHRSMPFQQYQPVLEKLRHLRANGTEIHYFEGNHDFHLGPYFTETIKANVYRSATVLRLDGKKVYACHGDQINDRDFGYRLLRFALHNRITGIIAPFVPPRITIGIADRMARSSKRKYSKRESRWNYHAILRAFAARRFAEGCDTVITGHFHVPLLERSGPHENLVTVSLGDWIHRYSYAEWENGSVRLKTYQPTSTAPP
jgi:UDP-2,3-diacylglucosamine hydrolase